jgi:hypothetical protein
MKLRGSLKAHNFCPQPFIVMRALLLLVSAANLAAQAPRPRATPPPLDSSIQTQGVDVDALRKAAEQVFKVPKYGGAAGTTLARG